MPKRDRAQYMREYRARKRREAQGTATATAAPFDFQDVDVERAMAEPPAGDPDAFAVTVRIDDAQFAKLAALMRAASARRGSTAGFDDAMRLAVEVAHRTIAGTDTAA